MLENGDKETWGKAYPVDQALKPNLWLTSTVSQSKADVKLIKASKTIHKLIQNHLISLKTPRKLIRSVTKTSIATLAVAVPNLACPKSQNPLINPFKTATKYPISQG